MRIGARFGLWEVIEKSICPGAKNLFWLCKCDCGVKEIIRVDTLKLGRRNGGCKSCAFKGTFDVGCNIGDLESLGASKRLYANGTRLWMFRCICSKIIHTRLAPVISGAKTHCGCKTLKNLSAGNTLPDGMGIKNRAFKGHRQAAKSRSYSSYLTKEEYLKIIAQPCVYCGKFSVRSTENKDAINFKKLELNSVDRKNNEPFYKLSNSQPVCFRHQTLKWTMSDSEFRSYIVKAANYLREHL